MKIQVQIDVLKVAGVKITPELANANLIQSTSKTAEILCRELEKYFKSKKIETKITYRIEK